MGCDIHAFVEWVEYAGPGEAFKDGILWGLKVPFHRNYTTFGAMAQVRRDIQDSFMRRGWPDRISSELEDYNQIHSVDLHSHSWLAPSEFRAAMKLQDESGYSALQQLPLDIMDAFVREYGEENVRIVFAFDN